MNKIQQEPESLSASLMSSAANDYTPAALIELGESVVDSITDALFKSDAINAIPVISLFVAFSKGILNYRDKRYVKKIFNFLSETCKATEDEKKKFKERLDANPEEAKKVGETILDILDKLTDLEKAKMVGKVFLAHMKEDGVTSEDVLTLSEMINKAYMSDLVALSRKDESKGERWNDANLESVGIKKPMRFEDVNNAMKILVKNIQKSIPAISTAPLKYAKYDLSESGFTDRGSLLKRILQDY